MNQAIRRVFVLVLGLILLLVAGTVRWTVVEADDLNANAYNRRPLLQTARVPRGDIRASDGSLLARSVKQADGTYERRYTENAQLASQLIGWAYTNAGTEGMEKEHQDDLTGKVRSAATLLSALRGNTERGNDVIATLDPKVQRAAINGLNGRKGAAVAIDVTNGGVLAMASLPNFDPNRMKNANAASAIFKQDGSPTFNRATQAGYPPGSTFKVVTTTAALETGDYTPLTIVDGSAPLKVETVDLNNFGGKSFGKMTLTQALTNSVNTAFARVAEDIGPEPISDAMDAYGFGKIPLIDYPENKLYISGVHDRETDKLLPVDGDVDIARVAIGQERLRVTPLQMGLVAAAVAKGGELPQLSTVERVVDPDGRTLSKLGDGKTAGRVMSEQDARELTAMMEKVVEEGSGTAAALSGLRVAGKTGTAERVISQGITQPWFIGFAPADNPKVAVAVTIERTINGTGGEVAAPIAKAMMEAALR